MLKSHVMEIDSWFFEIKASKVLYTYTTVQIREAAWPCETNL